MMETIFTAVAEASPSANGAGVSVGSESAISDDVSILPIIIGGAIVAAVVAIGVFHLLRRSSTSALQAGRRTVPGVGRRPISPNSPNRPRPPIGKSVTDEPPKPTQKPTSAPKPLPPDVERTKTSTTEPGQETNLQQTLPNSKEPEVKVTPAPNKSQAIPPEFTSQEIDAAFDALEKIHAVYRHL